MQPIHIIYLMKIIYLIASTILRYASIHKSAFYCHPNIVLESAVWSAFAAPQVSFPLHGGLTLSYICFLGDQQISRM